MGSKRFGLVRWLHQFGILCALLLFFATRCSAQQTTHFVDKETGVEIICAIDPGMFPASWDKPPTSITAVSLAPEEIDRSVASVKNALRKYPAAFLKQNLHKVYIIGALLYEGARLGGLGCLELKTVYIVDEGIAAGVTNNWLEGMMHHELSHLLAGNLPDRFAALRWDRLNSNDFHYGNGFVDAIKTGHNGTNQTDDYFKQGFICQYSTSSIGEDFATLCERLFNGDPVFQRGLLHNVRLRRKVEAVERFYSSLDPQFSKAYFQALEIDPKETTLLACLGLYIDFHDGKPILQVMKDSVADKAGLKEGDELVDFANVAMLLKPTKKLQKSVSFQVQRSGSTTLSTFTFAANLVIKQRNEPSSNELSFPYGGMYLPPLWITNTSMRSAVKVPPGSTIVFM